MTDNVLSIVIVLAIWLVILLAMCINIASSKTDKLNAKDFDLKVFDKCTDKVCVDCKYRGYKKICKRCVKYPECKK